MYVTRRQKEMMDFLDEYIERNGYAPTIEETAEHFGLRSLATVHKHLTNLQKKGLIKRDWNRSRALELVRGANPALPVPGFLSGPPGARMLCALGERDVAEACALLAGSYWNVDVPEDRLARAHVGAQAWVGARDADGALIGTARACSDGGKFAYLFDVMVAPRWRGRGLGQALVRLVLDHPAVRGARRVLLGTRDAMALYRKFGFAERGPRASVEMVLERQ